jgi:hypothetical protein
VSQDTCVRTHVPRHRRSNHESACLRSILYEIAHPFVAFGSAPSSCAEKTRLSASACPDVRLESESQQFQIRTQRSVGGSGSFVVGNGWRPTRFCAATTALCHRGYRLGKLKVARWLQQQRRLGKTKNGLTTGRKNPQGGTTVGRLEERRFDAVRRTETCAVAGGLTRMCRRRRGSSSQSAVVENKSSSCRLLVTPYRSHQELHQCLIP